MLQKTINRLSRKVESERAMLEAGEKPQPRIKNRIQRTAVRVLAGFFILMLVFTLVSRMADSIAVAKVETDTVKSAVLNDRVSLNGTIEPMGDMPLSLPSGVVITSVKVSVGQWVKTGDVLLELDSDAINDKLDKLRQDLHILELRIEIAANGGGASTVLTAQQALTQAQADYNSQKDKLGIAVQRAKEDLSAAQSTLDDATAAYNKALASAHEKENEAKQAFISALNNESQAENDLHEAQQRLSELEAATPPDAAAIAAAQAEVQTAQTALNAAKDAVATAKGNLDKAATASEQPEVISAKNSITSAEQAVKLAKRAFEDSQQNYDDQLASAKRAIDSAKQNLEQAEKSDDNSQKQAEIDQLTSLSDKHDLEEQIAAFEETAKAGGKLVSPIDGKVLSIAEKGTAQEGASAAVISRSDLGFSFIAKLDQKEAEKLVAGDKGSLSFTYEGRSRQIDTAITSIGAADDKGQVQVTADLPDGSYPSGVSGEMTVTHNSEKQNTCLPLSALRNDSKGDYVLVIREKKTVMGVEQTLLRVPVTVVARDSEQVAINSTLTGDDQVVVSSNKPISEGDRVRIETD